MVKEGKQVITEKTIETPRLRTHVRLAGDPEATPLVLVHGNASSGVFFEELMEDLAGDYYLVAPDYRGFGGSERKTIDATAGMGDLSDDVAALIETMGLPTPLALLGWSTGGGIIMRLAIDHPGMVDRLILESAASPYGFGGTRDVAGNPCHPDFAGSGGGTANPDFVRMMGERDRSTDNPASPLNTLRSLYVKTGFEFDPELEDKYLDGMLDTKTGDDVYPGDMTPSENWPGVAPGTTGINNALSPGYMDVSGFGDLPSAPPVLWIRGEEDQIVSDTSMLDFGTLGRLGLVPGWPGEDVYPPQPMVSQLRGVLEEAGDYVELVYEDCGHSPHIEKPDRFAADVRQFLG